MRLKDVAKSAGVSPTTVSRVLNGGDTVKTSTRKRVLKAIRELNYQPNLNARTLATGKSSSLGMVVSNLGNPSFLDILRRFEAAALAAGFEVLVAGTDYNPARLSSTVHSMMSRRPAGLALVVSEIEPDLMTELVSSDLRAVFCGVGVEGGNSTNIRVNYRLGMQSAIEYLYQLGHRRIAFIGHHMNLSPLQERYESFVAMGSQYRETEFFGVSAHDSPSGGAEATREILDSGFDPTAILCVNDYIAIGVLAELRDRGIQVPRQVSVIGFDNISLAPFVHPPLTTVNIPRARIAELMFQALTAGEIPDTVLGKEISVRPELVIRGTTGPARVPRASGLTGDGERTVPDCAGSSTGKSSTARQAPP